MLLSTGPAPGGEAAGLLSFTMVQFSGARSLDRALEEVGFRKVSPEEEPPEGVNLVSVVKKPHRKSQEPKEMSFSLGQSKGSTYIEGVIPAYIAARQLGNTARARG